MILAPNFGLNEMCRSATAQKLHIDNSLSKDTPGDKVIIENLRAHCRLVLQPIRDAKGRIRVNSGYRCPELNARVGGAKYSEHLCNNMRAAADIVSEEHSALDLFDFAIHHQLPYRTVILERKPRKDGSVAEWVHISHCRGQTNPRRKIMIIDKVLDIKDSYSFDEIFPVLDRLYRNCDG
jgi:hypothetical protein